MLGGGSKQTGCLQHPGISLAAVMRMSSSPEPGILGMLWRETYGWISEKDH